MVQIKLAVNRLKLLQQKKTAGNVAARRDIAQLLRDHKTDSARVRVEHIIREDFAIEAMEIIELYCEMLLARFGLLEERKQLDDSIVEAVCTVLYAAEKVEVKELLAIRDQFRVKFGNDLYLGARDNVNNVVNERVILKLSVSTPDVMLVDQYLNAIAQSFGVEWEGDRSSLLEFVFPAS
ncbi:Vacuolar protein sorting-associated protein ist1 [Irineochytrium annulatum]|nr:Vacuolar protein sorting-associated protein ist1 [Irineochytrium annulatum]